ncbi:hypothetical protein J6590_069360 [Homalodisca vitripennis]|nr:hypothetical protein J6590_069360 [Homalodisca vitripennis]
MTIQTGLSLVENLSSIHSRCRYLYDMLQVENASHNMRVQSRHESASHGHVMARGHFRSIVKRVALARVRRAQGGRVSCGQLTQGYHLSLLRYTCFYTGMPPKHMCHSYP